jgi:hypothetical protein
MSVVKPTVLFQALMNSPVSAVVPASLQILLTVNYCVCIPSDGQTHA